MNPTDSVTTSATDTMVEENYLNSMQQIWMMVFAFELIGGAVFAPPQHVFGAGRWPNRRTVDIPRLHSFWSRNFSVEQIVSRHAMFSCTHRIDDKGNSHR